jgi:replicative DNA helicase
MSEDFEVDFTGIDLSEPYVSIEEQDIRILKGILISEKNGREFVSKYDSSLFVGHGREFAKLVLDYYNEYKCFPTKNTLMEKYGKGELAGRIDYIFDQIDNYEYNEVEFNFDLSKIKDRYARNNVVNIKERLEELLSLDSADLNNALKDIKRTCNQVEGISSGERRTYVQRTLKDYIPEFRANFVNKLKNPESGRGILSGYSYFDYVTDGLHGGELMIIGGESGSGKSQMLHNIGVNIWQGRNSFYTDAENFVGGEDVLYFSLEMPFEVIMRRIMARLSQLSLYNIRNARIGKDEIEKLNAAARFIKNYYRDFEIVDIPRGTTVEQIEERYKEALACGRNPKIIIVDYLGLMEDDSGYTEDWLKLGYIAGKLHEFARAYNVAVITAVQLNRAPSKANADSSEVIGLHRIGRSSLIMTHANIGVQIESRKEEETYSDFIYHVIKNRDGEKGKHTLAKNFQCATLLDIEDYKPPSQVDEEIYNSFINDDDISEKLKEIGWFN